MRAAARAIAPIRAPTISLGLAPLLGLAYEHPLPSHPKWRAQGASTSKRYVRVVYIPLQNAGLMVVGAESEISDSAMVTLASPWHNNPPTI